MGPFCSAGEFDFDCGQTGITLVKKNDKNKKKMLVFIILLLAIILAKYEDMAMNQLFTVYNVRGAVEKKQRIEINIRAFIIVGCRSKKVLAGSTVSGNCNLAFTTIRGKSKQI